jgi:hypothetical protein
MPVAAVGSTGDVYFERTNNRWYGPKTSSGWGEPMDTVGPPGKDADLTEVTARLDALEARLAALEPATETRAAKGKAKA